MSSIKRIILVDGNSPWVVSLFQAVNRAGVEVDALQAHSLGMGVRSLLKKNPPSSVDTGCGYREHRVVLPGWTRFPRLSTLSVARSIRRLLRHESKVDAIVYTVPHYAGVAERISGPLCVYYAHDPFRFYTNWDMAGIMELERRMLDRADVIFCIAEALSEDFRQITSKPVVTCRNGTDPRFIRALQGEVEVPADVVPLKRPIVGCIGYMNRSYDWNLIEGLAQALPDVTFAYVGPVSDEPEPLGGKIKSIFAMPNVRWLGPKPHAQLPTYLKAFDVCFNSLGVSEHSDRRSPLRLYDYLCTNKPILSTPIREAYTHVPFIEIGGDVQACSEIIRRFVATNFEIDAAGRARYVAANTWDDRAAFCLSNLEASGRA